MNRSELARRAVNRVWERSLGARRRAREAMTAEPRSRHADLIAMNALSTVEVGYVPWSSMAMRPQGLLTVLNDIALNGRRTVVECGSGVSTLYIARLLSDQGAGHLHSVEHDQGWAETIGAMLSREGLADLCTIIIAPLEPANSPHAWYSAAALATLDAVDIDLLLVDGPPAYERDRLAAREPALAHFFERLAPDCTVILDDINRRGEREVVSRWEAAFGVRFERRVREGAIAVWRRGGPPPVA